MIPLGIVASATPRAGGGEGGSPPIIEGVARTELQFAASRSVVLPSGISAGDLLVVFASAAGGSGDFQASGSGWTLASLNAGSARLAVLTKTATGSDTLSVGLASSSWVGAIALRISGATGSAAVELASQTSAAPKLPPPASVSPPARGLLSIAACSWSGTSVSLTSYPSTHEISREVIVATGSSRPNLAVCARVIESGTGDTPAAFVLSGSLSAQLATVLAAS